MLESINWIRDYFDQSPDAVMIFQNDGLVLSNRLAQHLTNQIGLSPDYILQIAKMLGSSTAIMTARIAR